jgi:hypothetical protein
MRRLLRIVGPVFAVALVAQVAVAAKPCSKLTKELSELRLEYHLYAVGEARDSERAEASEQGRDSGRTRDIGRPEDAEKAEDAEETVRTGFDRLAEMLDKIIELKREMRKAGCKIRPRKKDLERQLKIWAKREAKSRR